MFLARRVFDSLCYTLIQYILDASVQLLVYVDVSAGIDQDLFFYFFFSATLPSFCVACLLFYLEEESVVPFPRRP